MSKIILPYVHPTEEEQRAVRARRVMYETVPELKELADKIHSHRLMPPPACDQCIQMAIDRIAKRK